MALEEIDNDKLEQMKSVWNTEMQVSLFHAMHDHKPVGISRFFQMAFIREKVNSSNNRKLNGKEIWEYLGTLYDINALNDSERLHILDKEIDFELPSDTMGFKEILAADYPRINISSSCRISTSSSSSSLCEKASETPEKKDIEQKQDSNQIEDAAKSEQRKRTRHSNQSGGTDSGTPLSSKRSRRL